MLPAKIFLTVPPYFALKPNTKRDYTKAYLLLRWTIFIIGFKTLEDGLKVMDFKIHSQSDEYKLYYVSIGTYDTVLTPDSKIKVYCTCPDFAYTFAYVLYKRRALLYEEEFPIEFKTIPPRHRNPYQIPFACKHVYTVLRFCIENKIKFDEKEVLKYNKRNMSLKPTFEMMFRLYKYLEKLEKEIRKRYKIRI